MASGNPSKPLEFLVDPVFVHHFPFGRAEPGIAERGKGKSASPAGNSLSHGFESLRGKKNSSIKKRGNSISHLDLEVEL